jgi:hypothetical protein
MRGRAVLISAIVVVAVASSGCRSSDSKADATVTACTPGPNDGQPVAEGQVTNSSSKTSNYSVRVSFYDASGNKITEGVDVVTGVEPATSSPWRVTGLGSLKGAVDCRLGGVTRNAAPGE